MSIGSSGIVTYRLPVVRFFLNFEKEQKTFEMNQFTGPCCK